MTLKQEVKVTSPDYKGMDKEKAVDDFRRRISHYESLYEPLDEEYDREYSYIRIYNQGERFLVNRVQGECVGMALVINVKERVPIE